MNQKFVKNLLTPQFLIKEIWQLLLTSMLSNSLAIFIKSCFMHICRWWPAQICNPRDVPTNIQNMRHQPGEFPVQFLGSHDYYWIHRGRVFSYQEGDKGSTDSGTNKNLAKIFKKGECTGEKIFFDVQLYKTWQSHSTIPSTHNTCLLISSIWNQQPQVRLGLSNGFS